MSEVCNNVSTDPHLQPLSGEALHFKTASLESNAWLDIAANGFWRGRYECFLFDVRVFSPSALSNHPFNPAMTERRDVSMSSMYIRLNIAILLH